MPYSEKQIALLKDDFGAAQSFRSTWEGQAQDIIDYMMPFRPDIIAPQYETEGRDKMGYIYLSHATHAGELMAAGIAARNANALIEWYRVETEDRSIMQKHDVKGWLETVKNKFDYVFQQSNFYSTYHEGLKDKVFLGSACQYIGGHPRLKVFFESLNLGECYPAMNQYGAVDKMYRKFIMTARNLAAKFGYDNLSAKTRKLIDDGGSKVEERICVLQAVRPRLMRQVGARDKRNKPWEDLYLEFDNNHVLREGGYDEFPFIFSRYDSPAGHVMGRGPGWTALPAVMQMQQIEQDRLIADQRALAPSYLLPSSLNGPLIDLSPNGITFIDADENLQGRIGVFPTSTALAIGTEDIKLKQQEISNIFFNDLMLFAMDPKMTATQFMQMAQEKMQMLGPFVGREQYECLNPVFRRTFNILWEAGEIPPPPAIIMQAGGRLKINYISPLALAQKASVNQGITQTMGFVSQAMQIDPTVRNRFDVGGAVVEFAENNGCPQKLLRSDEEFEQITAAQAKMQQEKEQQQMMLEAAKQLPNLSKGPEQGSPLEQLTQMMKQGAGSANG
jgi:hypothetical protein